jgi:S1-C subfamily serine protease
VAAAVAGAGVSRAVWPGNTGTNANQASPPVTTPTTSPVGGGNGSGGLFPSFGGGGTGAGSGATPTEGAGAPSDVSAIAAKVDPAVVDINSTFNYQGESGAGTGIVLSSDGLVLTNNHVIAESTKLTATDVGNGQTYTATVVGYDDTHDVALVQLEGASGLAAATLATGPPSTGEAVVAIGNAGGTGGTPTSAGGSVTALDQSINASDALTGGSESLSGLIEVNANIQSGDSGGPLVDSQGQVIGMDTAASDSFSFSAQGNQGYAIPISQASAIAGVIRSGSGNSVVHVGPTAFLGVMIGLSSASTNPLGGVGATTTVPVRGVPVSQVIGGSPASAAGVTSGSTITSFGGRPLTSGAQLTRLLVPYHPGQKASITWTDAQGASHTGTVTLASGPPS